MVRLALEDAGYDVYDAADGAQADQVVQARVPDLVVLDVVMPYVSGLGLLRRWRSRGLEMGVIVLTGYGDQDSVADALEAGADDHIAKPFLIRELVERVNAVLRRTRKWAPSSAEIVVGEVRLDLAGQCVRVGERVVPLSKTEVAVLRELMAAPGRALSSQALLDRVWGPQYHGDTEIVRTNMYRLRRKLNLGNFLHSRPGVGYFVAAPDAEPPP